MNLCAECKGDRKPAGNPSEFRRAGVQLFVCTACGLVVHFNLPAKGHAYNAKLRSRLFVRAQQITAALKGGTMSYHNGAWFPHARRLDKLPEFPISHSIDSGIAASGLHRDRLPEVPVAAVPEVPSVPFIPRFDDEES